MNFDRSLIFSYLEEDNIQRAYFRVRPLLSLEGDVRQEAMQLWPNEGGLRIVPDRNEQHTFKNRMRTLGAYCVVDLRKQPPEAGKIRTNKNYRPDHGEVNQYILYSDTVHDLPEHTFYQLLEGQAADYAELAAKAITPLFFIQQDDTLFGPVKKSLPFLPETAQEATGMLFDLPCPDGVTRKMLCMDDSTTKESAISQSASGSSDDSTALSLTADNPKQTAPESANDDQMPAAPDKKPDSLPIGETLQILDQTRGHEETLRQLDRPVSTGANLLHDKTAIDKLAMPAPKSDSLGGTPLIRTPLHVAVQQTKNRTQEVVNAQWQVGKYEPPAQNLPAGTTMRPVENPVETACFQMKEAWNARSAHDQLVDCILSLDGARSLFEARLCSGSSETMMQRVLRQRLQDLEAERLTALCELDRAHRDLDTYKQELLTALSHRITRETGKLESDKKNAEAHVASLKAEVNALTLQRDALLAKVNEIQNAALPEAIARIVADAQMAAPVNGIPLRLSPVSGNTVGLEELIGRIHSICNLSSIDVSRNAAIALLILLAICPRIGISCPTPAPASTLAKNLAAAMGWHSSFAHQYADEQRPLVGIHPIDASPALLMTSLPNYAPLAGASKLFLSRNTVSLTRNFAYEASQWPVWILPPLPFVDDTEATNVTPVSAASLANLTERMTVTPHELDTVMGPILKSVGPLSGSARKEMYRFVSICAGLMEGGLPAAVDWAIMLWIVPALAHDAKHHTALKVLLDEYPLSRAKL